MLLLIDFVIILFLAVISFIAIKVVIRLEQKDQIEAALAEQKRVAELAAQVEKINPEEINNNKSKVKETLDKIN